MKKIMIIEDDVGIRRELQDLLLHAGYQVESVDNFEHALEVLLKSQADLLLMDINIPYLNGELLLKEFRKKSETPVIMLTSRTSELDEVLSMTYGADDYIIKPYNPTILLLRIQNIFKRAEGNHYQSFYKDVEVLPSKGILKRGNEELELTKNEMIIFQYLLNHLGTIVTRDELMADLWNNEEYINDNALTVNISRLRNKLASFGYEEIIETRKGQGYILL